MKSKIVLTITILILSLLSLNAQHYYYSAGKKNYLNVDSTTVIAQTQKGIKLNMGEFEMLPNLMRTHQFKNSELVEIKFKKVVELREFNIQGIERAMYGYKMGEIPILLTGEILLMPKDGIDISQIINLFPNKIFIISTTKYNTFKLGVYNWSEIIGLANSIYDSGIVEYCHPNFIAEIIKHQQTHFTLSNTI